MTRSPGECRIVVCDELHADGIARFTELGYEPQVVVGAAPEVIHAALAEAHALVVRSATKVTAELLDRAPALEVVCRAGVGVDNVDVAAATERGVVVMNTPTGNTVTTAELALALLVSLARNVPAGDRRVRSGQWNKKGLMGTELSGKRLGVVGLGRIGRVAAERAQGLGMEVIAHDPYLEKTGKGSPLHGVALASLDELLQTCDFVTLHVPLTDETRGMISRERLFAMKPGARIINAARGGLIDEVALVEALDAGHLAGAALDVLAQEPPGADHPLVGRDDVIVTPHLGASSHEAQRAVALDSADQIGAWFADGVANNAVNAPAGSPQLLRQLAPWIDLVERMGSFLGQRAGEPIKKLEVTVHGKVAEAGGVEHLRLALLASLLRHQGFDASVNVVNAPTLAAGRGLQVLEGESEGSDGYTSLIRARASSRGGEESHFVAGTVFGGQPRFVRVEGVYVDLAPQGHLLVTRHRDRPGVLGALGTNLGAAGINVHRAQLGAIGAGHASAFLSIDRQPDDEVMARLEELEPIEEISYLFL
ncbi:phosphoglycerate dehydrogenase [Engelhardtia mirabilis]|uniref:D-3-phosphoglycerate dehydrogenase n=1 Tax=Engelhardtia mirabilis TaxID=2528011 RepID=A0A518BMX2_9BACT|nr:D-3-phosphoglycerate dehydrogenase [Planctomycetes bacterium Pla133]QDV02650.1 D-3-phosphoglycerate dehydrogenase [Planctomycetes bacterium Pla86]